MQELTTPSRGRGTTPPHRLPAPGPGAALEGLWVVLVANEGQLPIADGCICTRKPLMNKQKLSKRLYKKTGHFVKS